MSSDGIGGPRFGTSGVFRPVYLDIWNSARIKDIFVEQEDVTTTSAHLDVHADVIASKESRATVSVGYGVGGGRTAHGAYRHACSRQ